MWTAENLFSNVLINKSASQYFHSLAVFLPSQSECKRFLLPLFKKKKKNQIICFCHFWSYCFSPLKRHNIQKLHNSYELVLFLSGGRKKCHRWIESFFSSLYTVLSIFMDTCIKGEKSCASTRTHMFSVFIFSKMHYS